MRKKQALMMGLALVSFCGAALMAGSAEASSGYCREYTKAIRVGGRLEQAYGKACLQPDGSWEIVDLNGSDGAQDFIRDDIRDDLREGNTRVVIVDRYLPRPAYYRPVVYRPVYRPAPFCPPWFYGSRFERHHEWREHEREEHHGNSAHFRDERGWGGRHGRH